MAKKSVEAVFKSRDCREHKTREAAAARNRVLDAIRDLQMQLKEVQNLLKDSAVTADGFLFDVGKTRYYILTPTWAKDLPSVEELHLYPWNMEVDVDHDRVVLREWGFRNNERGYTTIYIDSLYVEKENAEKVIADEARKRIEEFQSWLSAHGES